MQYQKLAIGVGLALVLGAAVGAEQRGQVTLELPPLSGVSNALRFTAPWQPEGGGSTRLVGTVIDVRQMAVAKVKVRLRNLTTGEIVEETESNSDGEYSFLNIEPGVYVVEMLIGDRFVVALSNAGSIARFETLQTVIQLPGRWESATQSVIALPTAGAFIGMSAATTMAANTIAAAATENIPPAQPGVDRSP